MVRVQLWRFEEYEIARFIAIIPRSTLTLSGNICQWRIYGPRKSVWDNVYDYFDLHLYISSELSLQHLIKKFLLVRNDWELQGEIGELALYLF